MTSQSVPKKERGKLRKLFAQWRGDGSDSAIDPKLISFCKGLDIDEGDIKKMNQAIKTKNLEAA